MVNKIIILSLLLILYLSQARTLQETRGSTSDEGRQSESKTTEKASNETKKSSNTKNGGSGSTTNVDPTKKDENKKIDVAKLPSHMYPNIELNKYYHGELKLNTTETNNAMWRRSEGKWHYYSIDVSKAIGNQLMVTDEKEILSQLKSDIKIANVSQYQDLIIEVLNDGDVGWSNPDLYISLGDNEPSYQHNNISCRFFGEDICVISGKELEQHNVTKITIGVNCLADCKYKLQAEMEAEIAIRPGRMHKIYFRENQQRIFKFSVPKDDSVERIEFRGIAEDKFTQFEMLIMKGNNPPDTHEALILAPAWENGYIGKFYKNCYCFCVGCNYTILVSSKTAGYINLGGKTSQDTVNLNTHPGGKLYDMVPWWGINCYNYTVSDATKDFMVKLQTFSGNPDIYVNPLVPITMKNYSKAEYSSKEFWNEELVLDPRLRKEKGALTGPYFICIIGNDGWSTYKIAAQNENASNMLSAGLAESSYIDKGQVKLFYYTDQVLMDEKIKLDYRIHVMTGSVKTRAKLCPLPSDMSKLETECLITEDEILKHHPGDQETKLERASNDQLIPDHNVCFPNKVIQLKSDNIRKETVAQCVYVFAVYGDSNFTSHFTISVELEDDTGKNHPVILSEGVPVQGQVDHGKYKYFMFSIEDKNITEASIQLETLHGDADLYVSTLNQTPRRYHAEAWSAYNGLYKDTINLQKTKIFNLTHTYYIGVYGDETSVFTLKYYTKTKDGKAGIQKLMVGKKQSGDLSPNMTGWNAPGDVDKQPSMIYHFQVPRKMLEQDHSIFVRLKAHFGQFLYIVKQNEVPLGTDEELYGHKPGHWLGFEYKDVEIKGSQLISQSVNRQVKKSLIGSDEMVTFYVRVWPYLDLSSRIYKQISYEDKGKTLQFEYDIAFYDDEQSIKLVHGVPVRGVVSEQEKEYYYFDIDGTDHDIEITLSQISGSSADIVLSLNPENQFPTTSHNDYHSTTEFTTDSIVLTREMLVSQEKKYSLPKGKMKGYIGVYTPGDMSVYSLVVSQATDFAPLKLNYGQIQAGKVNPAKKKFYFIQASNIEKNSKPVQIELMPVNGKADLEVTLISNLSLPRIYWKTQSDKPMYKLSNQMGVGSMVLDPSTNSQFMQLCKSECVILIGVSNTIDPEQIKDELDQRKYSVHFKIQVSQHFQELVEGHRIKGSLKEWGDDAVDKMDKGDLSRYNFYKFYKGCSFDCDLWIDIVPDTYQSVISVLVNYENPEDITRNTTTLPTWGNDPTWTASFKVASSIAIEGTEPYFFEHHGQKATKDGQNSDINPESRGYYYIAVQSYEKIKYTITVYTKKHNGLQEGSGSNEKVIDIDPVYLGIQDYPIYLKPDQTKYFYYQNWIDERLQFTLDILNGHFASYKDISFSIGQGRDNKKVLNRAPTFKSQLPEKWLEALPDKVPKQIEVKPGDKEFCMLCTYVIKITNKSKKESKNDGEVKLQLVVQQFNGMDKYDQNSWKSKIELTAQRPQPLKMERHQKSTLFFELDEKLEQIEIEILLGDAKVELFYPNGTLALEYPCPMDSKMFIKQNIVNFNLTNVIEKYKDQLSKAQDTKNDTELALDAKAEYMWATIESKSDIFQGTAYLRKQGSLQIISDGGANYFDYTYDKKVKNEPKYFIYLPSSHKENILVNAQIKSFESPTLQLFDLTEGGKIYDADASGGDSKRKVSLFNFKVALKRLSLRDNIHGQYTNWADEFSHDQQYDRVVETVNSQSGFEIFKMINFELDPYNEIILVKVEGLFDYEHQYQFDHAQLQMSLQLSSNDVTYMAPDTRIRSVVSDDPNKYKIYEFYINEMNFPNLTEQDDGVDLFFTLTPCSGILKFYISDDYSKLFTERSELAYNTNKFSSIELSEENKASSKEFDSTIRVIHKASKVSQGPHHDKISEDMYDEFGIQGKRLKHIESLNGKKLYVGIKALTESELTVKAMNLQILEIDNGRRKWKHKVAQFKPILDAYSRSEGHESVFEIQAQFLGSMQPDFMDMYRVQNYSYGIQIENIGRGRGADRHFKLSWSPLMMQDTGSDGLAYDEMTHGVLYRVYLGFNNNTLDLFSSLCQLEETESLYRPMYSINSNNNPKRCLQPYQGQENRGPQNYEFRRQRNEDLVSEYEYDTPDLKIIKKYSKSSIYLKGNEVFKGLKTVVVLAHVFNQGKGAIALAYPPVEIEEGTDFDQLFNWQKKFFIIRAFVIVVGSAWLIFVLIMYISKRRNRSNLDRETREKGIHMQNIPSNSNTSMSSHRDSSAMSTSRQENQSQIEPVGGNEIGDQQHRVVHEDDDIKDDKN